MSNLYTRFRPFLASIKERYPLSLEGSQKSTHHLVLDLTDSGIVYQAGDTLGILPQNAPELVEKTLQAMRGETETLIFDKQGENHWPLHEYLRTQANLATITRKVVHAICQAHHNEEKRQLLAHLLEESNKQLLKEYLEPYQLWDFLLEHQEASLPPEFLCPLLLPLLPRFYSIASSQAIVGSEVHLTIALLTYASNGVERQGVCTYYLCNHAPLNLPVVPIYIQPNHSFTLPEDDSRPIIMIGPGTGVAPFRAFMQERLARKAPGKNWLFFGEWNRRYDFFYEHFWLDLVQQGQLTLDLAFSRDQEHKVYVQHRILEKGAELLRWIEEGAHIYICGDAEYMAKDVEAALLLLLQTHGGKDEQNAKSYLKQLRKEGRYLKDVY